MFALLNRKSHKLYDLSKDKWTPIDTARSSDAVTAFVDCGNASLVSTPAAELQRISDNVAKITKSKIAATANAEVKWLLRQEKALNAHSILDGKGYYGQL